MGVLALVSTGAVLFVSCIAAPGAAAAPYGTIEEKTIPTAGSEPQGIAAGPDGNIWFTENFSNRVARMTPAGQVTEFTLPVSGKYEAIVSGPDRNLWIAVNRPGATPDSAPGAILRVTPSGACTVFPLPNNASVSGLIARRDGTLVFSERWVTGGPTRIGQITTAGEITESTLSLKR